MPLSSNGFEFGSTGLPGCAAAVWMRVIGTPVEKRVLVTFTLLAFDQLAGVSAESDGSTPSIESQRANLEKAASEIFDARGYDEYLPLVNGCPQLNVRLGDLQ